jgi:hypothetical protein
LFQAHERKISSDRPDKRVLPYLRRLRIWRDWILRHSWSLSSPCLISPGIPELHSLGSFMVTFDCLIVNPDAIVPLFHAVIGLF